MNMDRMTHKDVAPAHLGQLGSGPGLAACIHQEVLEHINQGWSILHGVYCILCQHGRFEQYCKVKYPPWPEKFGSEFS